MFARYHHYFRRPLAVSSIFNGTMFMFLLNKHFQSLFHHKRVTAATRSFKFTVFTEQEFQQVDTSNNYNTSLVSGMNILKKVCYMTASFTAIHFFYDSVIISRRHLKQSRCQGNCFYFTILFATIHYNKRSAVDSRKSWRVCLFEENHGSPAVLKVPIYSTELVARFYVWKILR